MPEGAQRRRAVLRQRPFFLRPFLHAVLRHLPSARRPFLQRRFAMTNSPCDSVSGSVFELGAAATGFGLLVALARFRGALLPSEVELRAPPTRRGPLESEAHLFVAHGDLRRCLAATLALADRPQMPLDADLAAALARRRRRPSRAALLETPLGVPATTSSHGSLLWDEWGGRRTWQSPAPEAILARSQTQIGGDFTCVSISFSHSTCFTPVTKSQPRSASACSHGGTLRNSGQNALRLTKVLRRAPKAGTARS